MEQAKVSESGVRLKAKANIASFLATLETFDKGWDDERAHENGPIQDDHDGINTRSANAINAEHTARKLSMRKRYGANQPLFTNEEVAEDASALAVAVIEVDPNDINRKMKWGYTPLIEAAVKGDFAECKRLKEAGADLCIKDNSGKLAWQKAEARGHEAIADLLRP